MPGGSLHLRGKAGLDETPVGFHILRQVALLEGVLGDERHHVDVDQIVGIGTVGERVGESTGAVITTWLPGDWREVERLRSLWISPFKT